MRAGEICDRNAVILGRTDSIRRAAVLMREQQVKSVVIVESRDGITVPVGIVTDRDIVVNAIARHLDLDTTDVGDLMSSPRLSANEDDSIVATLKLMRELLVRSILITNKERALIGVLSIDDIFERLTEQLLDIEYIISRELRESRKILS